ncbi:MAG: 2-hydroxyacid dehydrogenase [Novosphingobium sp.]|nr:2-hydroxyacid dehydrogenase [Novosphingobium sp.]
MSSGRVLVMSSDVRKLVPLDDGAFPVDILTDHADRDGWLAQNGRGIRALVCAGLERIDDARLAMMPDLELISVIAAGMSGLDLEAARRRGIAVTNAGDLNAGDVADFAITLMLAHRRDLLACDAWVRDGKWPGGRMSPGRSIGSERVGIVGLGHIGKAIATRLAPFGCEIRWWGPNPKPDVAWERMETPGDLAAWASTLIVAAAGKDDTRSLIDADIIAAVGPEGLIVNVSRGFVIDEAAMKAALRDGRLGGAALDVVAREPDDGTGWADVPNVILAPHVAGATREAFAAVMAGAADNVRRLFAGEPLLRRVV